MAAKMHDRAEQYDPDRFQELFEEFLIGRISLNLVLDAVTRLLESDPDHAHVLQERLDQALRSGRLPEQTWERLTAEIDHLISEDDPTDWCEDRGADQTANTTVKPSAPDTTADEEQPATPELAPGSLLGDRFVVVSCEGGGSTGRVYKALDRERKEAGDPDPWVAIKVLAPRLCSRTEAMQALRNEVGLRQQLSHPNIVRVFEFMQQGSVSFISMEWVNGESLAKVLDRKRLQPLELEQAEQIISGIGQALAHAHGQRIVHGDVKPGNVMVMLGGEAKLIDFGIARLVGSDEGEAGEKGAARTPAYSSCEVLEGLAATVQDDVFALALLSYRILTGHRTFGELDALEAESAGREPARIESLTERRWQALRQALAFRRADRTRDVDSFLQQFFSSATSPGSDPEPVAPDRQSDQTFNPASMGSDPSGGHPAGNPAAEAREKPAWQQPMRVAVATGLAAVAIAVYLYDRTPPEARTHYEDNPQRTSACDHRRTRQSRGHGINRIAGRYWQRARCRHATPTRGPLRGHYGRSRHETGSQRE